MQVDLGLEIITIPFLNLPLQDYKLLIKEITNGVRNQNLEPFFIFDLDYGKNNKFEDAISFFIKDMGIKLLGLRHKSFARNAVSYDILSNYVNSDVALFSYDVDRADMHNSDISTMHYLPFLGEDVYAVKSPKFKPKADNKANSQKNMNPVTHEKKEAIRIFDPRALLIRPASERIRNVDNILQEMDQVGNTRLFALIDEYDRTKTNPDELTIFRALSKFHELKSSTKEFEKLQKIVKSSESTEYIKDKDYLKSSLDSLGKKKIIN
jgi:hypothetical protein